MTVQMTPEADCVTLKGTRHGLLICVREDADWSAVLHSLGERLTGHASFLQGAQVSLDLGWRELDAESFRALLDALNAQNVQLIGVLSTSLHTRTVAEGMGIKAIIGRLGLAHHQGRQLRQQAREQAAAAAEAEHASAEAAEAETEASVEPEPSVDGEIVAEAAAVAAPTSTPAPTPPHLQVAAAEVEQEGTLLIKRTLRSGQKAVYPGHIVLWGDLNSGAELEADGDIIVLGAVRGRVHAGAGGNHESQVWVKALHPTVIRIGDVTWTGDPSGLNGIKLPANVRIKVVKDDLCFETIV